MLYANRPSASRQSLGVPAISEYVLTASSRGPEILILFFENMILFTLFNLFNPSIFIIHIYLHIYFFLSFSYLIF